MWCQYCHIMTPATDDGDPNQPEDRRSSGRIEPGGRREHTLKLHEVADVLRTDVRKVKMLIREGHLRAIRISPKVVRVTERALGEFLHPHEKKI